MLDIIAGIAASILLGYLAVLVFGLIIAVGCAAVHNAKHRDEE